MTNPNPCLVVLFDSTSATLLGEKLLKERGIPMKIIPVPRHISSDCGVCIRFSATDRTAVEEALSDRVEIQEILPL